MGSVASSRSRGSVDISLKRNSRPVAGRGADVSLKRREGDPRAPCDSAAQFRQWVGRAFTDTINDPSLPKIYQAYVLLTHKYMDFYATVPKTCRESVGSRGHRCIHGVYMETYQSLRKVELELSPLLMPGQKQMGNGTPGGTLIGLPPVPEDEL